MPVIYDYGSCSRCGAVKHLPICYCSPKSIDLYSFYLGLCKGQNLPPLVSKFNYNDPLINLVISYDRAH